MGLQCQYVGTINLSVITCVNFRYCSCPAQRSLSVLFEDLHNDGHWNTSLGRSYYVRSGCLAHHFREPSVAMHQVRGGIRRRDYDVILFSMWHLNTLRLNKQAMNRTSVLTTLPLKEVSRTENDMITQVLCTAFKPEVVTVIFYGKPQFR